jgi:mono/diheme cytochrome c family protein
VGLVFTGPLRAQGDDSKAMAVAQEMARMVSEATGVIGGLQGDINAGKAADKTALDQLYNAFQGRYAKNAGKPFEDKGEGLEGEARKVFASSLRDTFTKFGPVMAKGGNDAFVPAFFRAELLKRFNGQMKGKIQAYATTRDSELINADWSVDKVMKGSPFAGEVAGLMKTGDFAVVNKRSGDRLMLYSPMKLGAACVACHAANGVNQKEGGFGGALVTEVWIK